MSVEQKDTPSSAFSGDLIDGSAYTILRPLRQTNPVIFASPHSGANYPASFVAASRLDPVMLRRSEDAFIDELYEDCVQFGSPLLKANFPRAYVDPNREAYELDPAMFEDRRLPSYVNTQSPRARAGLGTIAKVVTNGTDIYKGKLTFQEARQRIDSLYHPYHSALRQLIEETRSKFGCCLLIDCHSMPSIGGPMDYDNGLSRTDIILGDRFGTSCDDWISDLSDDVLKAQDFVVRRNRPYAGGYTTAHYGTPKKAVHALQIELNRVLYMDEESITKLQSFSEIKQRLSALIERLCQIKPEQLLQT